MINKTIELWEKQQYNSSNSNFVPTMDTYILDGDKKRGSVLICPGGGYAYTSEREAEPIAMKFNAAGYHAFVLHYSVAPTKHPQPLLDVSKAMCIIRKNSEKWNIESDKIAVCGFSAGGHLTASLGVHWDKDYVNDAEGIIAGLNYPNALILNYPVITSGELAHRGSFDNLLGKEASEDLLNEMSLEKQVNKKTPPTFLWHTVEDASVPMENSLLFAGALRKNDIPFELHLYPHGPHGLSLATEETRSEDMSNYPHVATWIKLCIEWLENVFDNK
ncbi:alpha/beta hydrolase [Vallitalea guaymasensis]|uniref:alpha/beta hydrolase n=1 Tax=Vallitalea guaymasensis TaxID=1185412 RepID=UPI0023537E5F|nr:alpha/beta hydrolase [Vallitalea guaymasensis]